MWLQEEGGEEQQREDVPLNRNLQLFEQTYRVNLTDLLFSELDKQQHEQIRLEYERTGQKPVRQRRSKRRSSKRRRRSKRK